ncbi:MAG: replication-associated recombination protein A [Candidatus Sericytochromatia bacterium]|nr:replication-associated recombination protein A [Candidatus Tanganyikabacteria bacterium]
MPSDRQGSLFSPTTEAGVPRDAPLAHRMRPRSLDEILGQDHILGPGRPLRRLIESDRLPTLILWGPPGTGKTTLAMVVARTTRQHFVPFSAVTGGLPELRKILDEARKARRTGERTILFLDEIHRFNKAQQDALLPHVEDGTITLIGATTENPSFEVNPALRSRARILTLRLLDTAHIRRILETALVDADRGLGLAPDALSAEVLDALVTYSGGDARTALSALESAVQTNAATAADVQDLLQKQAAPYDKAGENHFDVVSALIKSIRGSDPDAALHYLARMIEGGEDPLFIARRLVIAAAEDIGNADPRGLMIATAAMQAVHQIGMPEGRIPLAQATAYLASTYKSNAAYRAIDAALADLREHPAPPVPLHLRNAPTRLMESLGYGAGYVYPHDEPGNFAAGQTYWPAGMTPRRYYQPTENGEEARIRKRLEDWSARRGEASDNA